MDEINSHHMDGETEPYVKSSVIKTKGDGGYLISGYHSIAHCRSFAVKLDSSFSVEWSALYDTDLQEEDGIN